MQAPGRIPTGNASVHAVGEAISVTYQHTNDLFGGFAWLWLSEIVVVLGLSCEHPTLHCTL